MQSLFIFDIVFVIHCIAFDISYSITIIDTHHCYSWDLSLYFVFDCYCLIFFIIFIVHCIAFDILYLIAIFDIHHCYSWDLSLYFVFDCYYSIFSIVFTLICTWHFLYIGIWLSFSWPAHFDEAYIKVLNSSTYF